MPRMRRKRKSAEEEKGEVGKMISASTSSRETNQNGFEQDKGPEQAKRSRKANAEKLDREQSKACKSENYQSCKVSVRRMDMSKLLGSRVKMNDLKPANSKTLSTTKRKSKTASSDKGCDMNERTESGSCGNDESGNQGNGRAINGPYNRRSKNSGKFQQDFIILDSKKSANVTVKRVSLPLHVESESDGDFEEVDDKTDDCDVKKSENFNIEESDSDDDFKEVPESKVDCDDDDDDFEAVDDIDIEPYIKKAKKEPKATSDPAKNNANAKTVLENKLPRKKNIRKGDQGKSNAGKNKNKNGTVVKSKSQLKKLQKSKTEDGTIRRREVITEAGDGGEDSSMNKLMQESDVVRVLMQMEGNVEGGYSEEATSLDRSMDDRSDGVTDDEERDQSDWEEVEDHPLANPSKTQISQGSVQIRLEVPDIMPKKRKRKGFDWKAYFNRLKNRFKKNLQLSTHKVHLLCLLSHGMCCSRVCLEPLLHCQAFSLLPTDLLRNRRPQSYHIDTLCNLVVWFSDFVPLDADLKDTGDMDMGILQRRFSEQKAASEKEIVLLFVILLRMLGLETRLVISLQPVQMKMTSSPKGMQKGRKKSSTSFATGESPKTNPKKSSQTGTGEKSASKKLDDPDTPAHGATSKYFKNAKKSKLKGAEKSICGSSKTKMTANKCKDDAESEVNGNKMSAAGQPHKLNLRTKNDRKRTHSSKISPNVDSDEVSSDFEDDTVNDSHDSDYSNYSDDERKKKSESGKTKQNRAKDGNKDNEKKSQPEIVQLCSDDEFEDVQMTFRKSPTYPAKSKRKSVSKKMISSDSDDSVQLLKADVGEKGSDYWVEVFLKTEEKWICVDVIHNSVNNPGDIEQRATQPISYILAFHNDGSVKDLTAHYASHWMSHTRKLRVESEWWEETLAPYKTTNLKREETENVQLTAQLMKKSLPVVIGEFKDHPLYALRRHLLKFEAIYPETAVPLGYIKKEPVYARECVHTLHSRENWLKEGLVVKLDERPYKMVKSRPKWNRPKENKDALDLGIFGSWQTEIYVPPPAKDGKVHRNEYGNIELFKPSMLPAGTVHLRVQGLNKVAKKLNIDCVPAMMGWEHHSGFAHPILDGFVVCEEHEDILLSAWEEDQEIQRQREAEKRDKRVTGNWKLLVRGMLIRERLKKRFDLEKSKLEEVSGAGGEKATDAAISWPRNRLKKASNSKKDNSETSLVEVEKL